MVTLYKSIVGGQTGGQIGGQISGQINILTERQIEILKLIEKDTKISRKEIAQTLKIAESAIQKHIKTLTSNNFIERVGTKNGYWKISKK